VNQKTTILIVDDEPDVREVLEEYFVAHGYAVIGAESAGARRRCRRSTSSTWRWSTSTCPARMA
jgi:DNA-binding response OmpR family regulator